MTREELQALPREAVEQKLWSASEGVESESLNTIFGYQKTFLITSNCGPRIPGLAVDSKLKCPVFVASEMSGFGFCFR
jgi:hypothetical protein